MDQLPDGASLVDLGEHRLRDLARPEHVFQLLHPEMPPVSRPLATADERTYSLPAEPSPFVGRDQERSQLVERLCNEAVRLLTLTGPGGIGKTRLALRGARDVEDRFAAGAAFVDLSEARDTGTLLTTVARRLGFADASADAQLGELIAGIGNQQLLAVLDNFEQVTATAPTLARILAECPELKLLVTSREPLHVRGEHILAVPPMGLPEASATPPTAERVERFEAVRLFVERAREVQPDFAVTDGNATIVAEICRRLEGLPLAIELAAARLRVFSLEALRDRLGSRLRALGGGARDLPQRQQTLRAAIDWSYQLLDPAEQRLFAVLACFEGTTIEAVEGVVGQLHAWPSQVEPVDSLTSLVDKSLMRRIDSGDEPRFEMLESIREYALERLEAEPPLAADARLAHARYYARWTESLAARSGGADDATTLSLLATEVENLRAAWRGWVGERDLDRLQALMGGLWRLYDARGWYRGVTDLAGDVLAVLDALESTPERQVLAATLRGSQARALMSMEGFSPEVEAAFERLLESVAGGDAPQVFPVLRALAAVYAFRAEQAKAAEIGHQMLRLAEAGGDPSARVDGYLFAGTGTAFGGRLGDGLALIEEGVRWQQTHPYAGSPLRLGPDSRVSLLTASSLLHWWQGSLARSLERSHEAITLATDLGHPSTLGYASFHAGLLRLWRRDPQAAREHAVRAVEVAEEHELHIWTAVGTVLLGAAAVELGVHEEGLRWIADGMARYRGLRTPPVFWPFLLQVSAAACATAGRAEEGLRSIAEAIELSPMVPDAHVVKGDLLLVVGQQAAAVAAYQHGLELARGWGSRMSELRAQLRFCRMGDGPDGPEHEARFAALRDSVASFGEGPDAPDLVEARRLLSRSS
jgi:predicted ATPase